jgi:predicted nuclease with TOPRIM domain
MGKREKEHRAKVAKRNQRISTEKSKMQKMFDKLLSEQMEKFKQSSDELKEEGIENLNVQVGSSPVEFSIVDTNDITTETTEEK